MVDNDMPGAWPVWTPRGTVGSFYKGEYNTLVHTTFESSGPYGLGEEDFLCFSHDAPRAGPVWTPGAHLAGFIAGFIKRTTIHCYKQNMKALSLVVSEKKIFLCFTQGPHRGEPIWTPGARLAGFKMRTTIHCYLQNMKALGLVVSEKKIFKVFPMTPPPPPRGGDRMDPRGTVGRIYNEDHHTLLQTKYGCFGPCGFGDEDFLCFTHDPPPPLGRGSYGPQGHSWQD